MKYFVCSNLSHNGTELVRGDTIELSDAFAAPLLEAGAIQTDKITEAPKAPTAPVEEDRVVTTATVGGEKTTMGEPSIDGKDDAQAAPKEAVEAPKAAQDAGHTVPPAKVAPEAPKAPAAAEKDLSTDL